MAVSMLKVQPISHSADIAHEKYQSLLSPYAAAHVVKQLDSAESFFHRAQLLILVIAYSLQQ